MNERKRRLERRLMNMTYPLQVSAINLGFKPGLVGQPVRLDGNIVLKDAGNED